MPDEYGHRIKAFSLRMEPELRAQLTASAEKNGTTLTSEINKRLQESLVSDSEKEGQLGRILKLVEELPEKIIKAA